MIQFFTVLIRKMEVRIGPLQVPEIAGSAVQLLEMTEYMPLLQISIYMHLIFRATWNGLLKLVLPSGPNQLLGRGWCMWHPLIVPFMPLRQRLAKWSGHRY